MPLGEGLAPSQPDIMTTALSRPPEVTHEAGMVLGCSRAILALNTTVEEIAGTDIPVLLQGDSGTGKEVYARFIHRLSARGEGRLTKLNCTLLNAGQLLAGVTGAVEAGDRENSRCGTLFLDGVDELDLDCQRVLLSLLQGQESESSGSRRARLISTATRNLQREVEAGGFRRELYFRIAGTCLRLPALKERKEDIGGLMEFYLEKHSQEMGRRAPKLRDEELELLQGYDWPGNIRELSNLAKKIAALGESRATIAEMRQAVLTDARTPAGLPPQSLKAAARTASRLAERDLIMKALERTHWNRKQAARDLQISYKALLYKIKQIHGGFEESKGHSGEKE